jgi:hypothetical protein
LLPFTPEVFIPLFKNVKIRICKTIILPVVQYGCGNWSVLLREEYREDENRVLRRIFRPKINYVIEGWRDLHKEEFNNLCTLAKYNRVVKSRRIRRAGHVARVLEKRNTCRTLLGKPEGKRPLGKPKHMWVDDIKCGLSWSGSGLGQAERSCESHNEPSRSVKCW